MPAKEILILLSLVCPNPIGPVGQNCQALVRERQIDECPADAAKATESLAWQADFYNEPTPPVACVLVTIEEPAPPAPPAPLP